MLQKIRYAIRTSSLALLFLLTAVFTLGVVYDVHAQEELGPLSGTMLLLVNGAISFPTGRFAETIEDPEAFKAGHEAGRSGGVEVGYFLGDMVAIGVGYDYTEFGLDFGSLAAAYPTKTARSTIPGAQVWGRFFPVGGYAHWKPYVSVGLGLARWRGTVEYMEPLTGDSLQTIKTVTTVDPRLALTGGFGVIVPVHQLFVINLEGRYRRVSSKGASREEEWTSVTGDVLQFQYPADDPNGRRWAKSNTNWWEIRAGIALTLR